MKRTSILLVFLATLISCQNKKTETRTETVATRNLGNSIYYWKTTFKLSDIERKFIVENQIKRLYLRYFDVYHDVAVSDKNYRIRLF